MSTPKKSTNSDSVKLAVLTCGLLGASLFALLLFSDNTSASKINLANQFSSFNDDKKTLAKNETAKNLLTEDNATSNIESQSTKNSNLDSTRKSDTEELPQKPNGQKMKDKISIKDSRDIIELGSATVHLQHKEKESAVIMNDPNIQQAWGLKKSDADKAWEISKGSKRVVVAIIDTGADIKHEDLQGSFWKNPNEIPNNGIDDDKNGFIDDVYGWNFVNNDNDLADNHGHGTHIAGIVGAQANNGVGIAGIAPEVSLMILKYYDPKVPNTDNLRNTVMAIRYATKMGANIINYSGGGTEFSADEKAAIEEARNQGILFVAAAGNERSNSDKHKYYPADYGLSNIISVTAIDPNINVLDSSNYGVETVDIAAPGQNILSTLPGSKYGQMTGTSQATAFVTGAAVLVMAHKNNSDVAEVKKFILSTGDTQVHLLSKTKTARKLNLFKALTMLDSGTSASGVIAANTANLQPLPSDLKANTAGGSGLTSMFGRSLMESLENNHINLKKKN